MNTWVCYSSNEIEQLGTALSKEHAHHSSADLVQYLVVPHRAMAKMASIVTGEHQSEQLLLLHEAYLKLHHLYFPHQPIASVYERSLDLLSKEQAFVTEERRMCLFEQAQKNLFSGESVTRESKKESPKILCHFFGFWHLPVGYLAFLTGLDCPCYFYLLSACKEFQGDLLTVAEIDRLFKRQLYSEPVKVQMERYLAEDCPILAEYGKPIRAMLPFFEEGALTFENYTTGNPSENRLKALQYALLHNSPVCKSPSVGDDKSLVLVRAASAYQEIEELNGLVERWRCEGLPPEDIVVMSSDICSYIPWIRTLITKVAYQIDGVPLDRATELFSTLKRLLSLPENRYSATSYLELLYCPLFYTSQKFDKHMLAKISHSIDEARIHFGIDSEYLHQIFSWEEIDSTHTWQAGFERLKEREQDEEMTAVFSLTLTLFRHLSCYVAKRLLFSEWIAYVKELISKYLSAFDPKELCHLDDFAQKFDRVVEPHDFATFRFFFLRWMATTTTTLDSSEGKEKKAIRFGTLESLSGIQAKGIVLLGMQESKAGRPLEGQAGENGSSIISALISAQEKLLISYIGFDPVEGMSLRPGSFVGALCRYVGDIPIQDCVLGHTMKPAAWESVEWIIPYTAAPKIAKEEIVLDLFDVKQALYDPLGLFFKNRYKIKWPKNDLDLQTEFVLTRRERAKLERELLLNPAQEALTCAKNRGSLPVGVFARILTEKIQCQKRAIEEKRNLYATSLTIELKRECKAKEELRQNYWVCPPVELEFEEKKVHLVGKLEGIFDGGLIIFGRHSLNAAWSHLPYFLTAAHLSPFACDSLLFGGDGKKKKRFFQESIPLLTKLISLVERAKREPVYVTGALIPALLQGETSALQKEMNEMLEGGFHPGYQFAAHTLQLPEVASILERSRADVHDLKEVVDGWL